MSTTITRPGSRRRRTLAGALTTALAASTLALLPATSAHAAPVPTVSVSKTSFLPDGTQSVTVTGAGFDPSLATGTRPPFAGQQSGLYIAFGRYADVWRASAGAPSSARNNPTGANANGAGVKWAVPLSSFAASFPVQDPNSPAYTELKPDGSFSTTIQVNQAWLASVPGNFGIYTYAGGGATVADYETYTPIKFEVPPVVQPSSTVSVKRGSTKKPTTKETGKTSVTVKAANGAEVTGGKVKVTFKQKGKKSKTKTVTVKNGKANVTIPKLAKGKWTVSVKYLGAPLFKKTATLKRGSFTVKK